MCPRKLTINLPRCGHQAKVPGAIRGQCPNWQYWMGCKWETEMVTKAPGGQWLNGLSRWPNMFPTCSQHVPNMFHRSNPAVLSSVNVLFASILLATTRVFFRNVLRFNQDTVFLKHVSMCSEHMGLNMCRARQCQRQVKLSST